MGALLTPPFICTVRGCAGALSWEDAQLRCPSGHAFDRAREGYWNLLQPQDRRSSRAGDSEAAVSARRRWLARGNAIGLTDVLASRIDELSLPSHAVAVDVGCGEGTLTARLLASREIAGCGIDLSRGAIRLAARAAPQLTWVVANADRGIPLADASVSLALSIFGRRPASELRRVVAKEGTLLVVVPGEDDLIELREVSQGTAVRRDRVEDTMAELGSGFDLVWTSTWRHRACHDREALVDALAMSYRGARESERERLEGVSSLDVTLSAEILALVPRDGLR